MTDRILVVDDDKKIVKMIKDFLEMEQYQVITAYDGEAAIRQTQQNPDLILLDINMPGMNGLEICRTIRDMLDCPIIFLTARIEERDKIIGLRTGGDDYIVKI